MRPKGARVPDRITVHDTRATTAVWPSELRGTLPKRLLLAVRASPHVRREREQLPSSCKRSAYFSGDSVAPLLFASIVREPPPPMSIRRARAFELIGMVTVRTPFS